MLMAFESAELAAHVISRHRAELDASELATDYANEYVRKFDARLRLCAWLRRAAFSPRLAGLGIAICGASKQFPNWIARATRSANHNDPHSLHAGS